ncbi:MAG: hypothetical protein ISS27_01010 [Candidatus Omnitrophica bacterium]|nr:hypothetical protein [Candidatus Omnitrophota bacterium]
MNKKGIALVLALVIVMVLLLLGGAMLSRSMAEVNLSNRYLESIQAFWLAEAGINQALIDLRSDYSASNVASTTFGEGGYSAVITANVDGTRTVTATGFIPSGGTPRIQRTLESVMNRLAHTPANFFSQAIYSAGDITFAGAAYSVAGDVMYSGTFTGTDSGITGDVTDDPSITPLAHLDFDQLKTISQAQGNYHDVDGLDGPFPTDFWYDEVAGIPNVVYLEGAFDLSGKNLVGGFFIVGGDVVYDAELSGNVAVDGAIYTLGNFTLNGGGSALNINGGVWSGQNTTITGSSTIAYNAGYMNAIQNLGIVTTVQMLSWDDTQDPYNLVP